LNLYSASVLVEFAVVSGELAVSQERSRAVGFTAWVESFVGMRGLEVGSEFGVCQERGPYAGGARKDGAEKTLESSSRARKKTTLTRNSLLRERMSGYVR